jgi:hypothetical protein
MNAVKMKTGKRVAVVVFSPYPADPRPRRAAEALAQLGLEVDVICVRENGREPLRETFNGVQVFRVPLRRRRGGAIGYVYQYAAFIAASFALLSARSLTRR